MSRGPQSFTSADITKFIRAVEKAGFTAQRVEVRNKDGSILRFDRAPGAPQDDPSANEWDRLE